MEEIDINKLVDKLPLLWKSAKFREHFRDNLGEEEFDLPRTVRHQVRVGKLNASLICDAAIFTIEELATVSLTIGWDGNFPGSCGAVWIFGFKGVFIMQGSDCESSGPYASLDDAYELVYESLADGSLPNPEISGEGFSLEDLLLFAEGTCERVEGESVLVNDERYVRNAELELIQEDL